ncbi:MAG: Asp23/Gls24 family envelope stress response protein [Oscillospiraceae bacterium]|jgi:uncharacterized alkaline shock family protein YloU|nr:Asp23/Gls24 family envelope stress response protein [Oscillospiraceae bacterium]
MLEIRNHLGTIHLTRAYFRRLIDGVLDECFGVVGTNAGNRTQSLLDSLPFMRKRRYSGRGVAIAVIDGAVYIELHIIIAYGVNIPSVCDSIRHKLRYAVEEETELSVAKVSVFVDGIK